MIRDRLTTALSIGVISTINRSQATTLAICCFVTASCHAFAAISIPRPNYGVPEFAVTGGTFKVEVKASVGLTNTLWSAVLVNDLRSWTGTVEQAEYGTYVDNNTVAGYRLTVRVPADVSPEVFKLVVSHPNGGAATNRNAVSIIQDLETDFYILHYTDIQVTAMEPTNPDTGEANLNGDIKGSIREIYWHAPAVNLINPRFMFHTGDEKENNWGGETEYELYIEASCNMLTPAFVSRGNNDSTTTTDVWRRQFGVETYSCTMGSFYICMKDFRENNFMPWFSDDYVASFTNSAIKYRLFGQHYNSGGSQWMPPTGQGRDPDLMLVGHGHANSTLQPSYPILETQAAFVRGAVGFFQFNKSADDWTCTTLGDPWFQLMSYGATAKINNTLSYANDGTQTTNTATIVNNIAKNFFDGRVRFLMKYSATGYSVSNGVKLAEYAYNGNSNMAVVVKVNIAKSATTVVGIQPLLTLTVNGPAYGQSSPAYGVYTNSFGTSFTVAVTNSPVLIGSTTQYVCQGWTGSGSVPASGSAANTGTLTLTNDSAIAWSWTTNYSLATTASNGTVDVTNGWKSAGSNITVTAVPDLYYHFMYWSGDVTAGQTNSNPLALVMDRPRAISATFAAYQATNGTPHWWLARYALTTNDAGALYDDGDGVPAWQEYVADTDPTNKTSYFHITAVSNLPPLRVYFLSSSNRQYTLNWNTNLSVDLWTNAPDQSPREGAGGPDWMQDTNVVPAGFYRLDVRLP